ncbi:hypothetical protein KM043_006957 [Ampulex compressa]|nr:hypothetical protein KM043_006957 [Ampulex compressa]
MYRGSAARPFRPKGTLYGPGHALKAPVYRFKGLPWKFEGKRCSFHESPDHRAVQASMCPARDRGSSYPSESRESLIDHGGSSAASCSRDRSIPDEIGNRFGKCWLHDTSLGSLVRINS